MGGGLGLGAGEWGAIASRFWGFLWDERNVLELDRGGGWAILWKC